jgi:hypothetical protein
MSVHVIAKLNNKADGFMDQVATSYSPPYLRDIVKSNTTSEDGSYGSVGPSPRTSADRGVPHPHTDPVTFLTKSCTDLPWSPLLMSLILYTRPRSKGWVVGI